MSIGLIRAAANNKVHEVYYRLRAGENANFRENLFGDTALHKATICKHGQVMDLLLNFGANPDIPNFKGLTANDYYAEIQGNGGYFNLDSTNF